MLNLERFEDRCLTTLIFVLNGNSFAAAGPNQLTASAAAVLQKAGNQVVQLSNPTINTPAAYNALARKLLKLSHSQDIGLVGFSAGGALAIHLAAKPGLKVDAVLDYYGVPDIQAYLHRHAADHKLRPISGLAPFRPPLVSLLSGTLATSAHVIAAFGARDPNVRSDTSSADLLRDDPSAHIYAYPGGHGVSITASRPALADFLSELS